MYTIYMHVGTQKSIILREGYATVFYVIQGAKRRIISLRASKSEALSYRMTGRCTRGKDREPFDRMTEIGGFDLQEWRTPLADIRFPNTDISIASWSLSPKARIQFRVSRMSGRSSFSSLANANKWKRKSAISNVFTQNKSQANKLKEKFVFTIRGI